MKKVAKKSARRVRSRKPAHPRVNVEALAQQTVRDVLDAQAVAHTIDLVQYADQWAVFINGDKVDALEHFVEDDVTAVMIALDAIAPILNPNVTIVRHNLKHLRS